MKNYIRYEIEKRKYSANVIVGVYELLNSHKGKYEDIKEIVVIPALPKVDGDLIAEEVCISLNKAI